MTSTTPVIGHARSPKLDRTRPEYAPLCPRGIPLRIQVFADGANAEEMLRLYRAGSVAGFTTNPTLMRQSGVSGYSAFARELLAEIRDVPISFEVFADEFPEMDRQARLISSWGNNVFVKIPVTNCKGESSAQLINSLAIDGVKLNVTAVLTLEQVALVCDSLDSATESVISVFAGRIADTGRDPMPIMSQAVRLARHLQLAQVLWASPREVLNVYQAEACGCHIITVTKPLLDKLASHCKDLDQLSLETVRMFYDDALRAGYSL